MGRTEISNPLNWPRQQPSVPSRGTTNVANAGIKSSSSVQTAKNSTPIKDSLVKLTSPLGFGRDSHGKQERSTTTSPTTTHKNLSGSDGIKSTLSIQTKPNTPAKDSLVTLTTPQLSGWDSHNKQGKSATSSHKNTSGSDDTKSTMWTQTKYHSPAKDSLVTHMTPQVNGRDSHDKQTKTTATTTTSPTAPNSTPVSDGSKPATSIKTISTSQVLGRDSNAKLGQATTSFTTHKTNTVSETSATRNVQTGVEKVQHKKTSGESPTPSPLWPQQPKLNSGPHGQKNTFSQTPSSRSGYPEQRNSTVSPYGETKVLNDSSPLRSVHSEKPCTVATSKSSATLSGYKKTTSESTAISKTSTTSSGDKETINEPTAISKTSATSSGHTKSMSEANPTHTVLPEKPKAECSPETYNKTDSATHMEYSGRSEPLAVSTTPMTNFIPTIERRSSEYSTTSLSTISAVSASSKPDPDGEYGSQLRKQPSNHVEVSFSESSNNMGSSLQYSVQENRAKYEMSSKREPPAFDSSTHTFLSTIPGSAHGFTCTHDKPTATTTVGSSLHTSESQIAGTTHGSKYTHEKPAASPTSSSSTHTQSTILGSTHGSTHTHNTAVTAASVPGPASLTDIELALFYAQSLDSRDVDAIKALAHPHCDTQFAEINMKMTDFLNEFVRVFKAFPDLNFLWKDIKQVQPGVVEIGFFQVTGTHTGEPWGFEPFPAVPAEGRKVKTDPERIVFQTEGGKFRKITYIASSDQSGLPGIYRQIGGFPM
uniref:SnoaL-like domain-containing protein n=1 Tax=Amphora coffeiformis TaxID=265554 RepID=A0A7S3KXR5_9STRA